MRARRTHSFADAAIVIDEAQTAPRKTSSLFNETINFLTRRLVCAATQPYFEETERRMDDAVDILPYGENICKIFQRTEIVDASRPAMSVEEPAKFITEKYKESGSVLAVCNTKAKAPSLYTKLKTGVKNVYHFSAAICTRHRLDVVEKIKNDLKNKTPPDLRVYANHRIRNKYLFPKRSSDYGGARQYNS